MEIWKLGTILPGHSVSTIEDLTADRPIDDWMKFKNFVEVVIHGVEETRGASDKEREAITMEIY